MFERQDAHTIVLVILATLATALAREGLAFDMPYLDFSVVVRAPSFLENSVEQLFVTMLSCIFLFWLLHTLYSFLRLRQYPVPKGCKDPPRLIGAWIPFVGSGPELSKDSIAFVEKYHKSHGDVFQTKIGLFSAYFVKDVHFAASVVSRQPEIYSFHE